MTRLACLAFSSLLVPACTDAAQPIDPDAIGLADVSVLLPLPADTDDTHVLRLDTTANGGALLPRAMFDAIPAFADNPIAERAYEHWRIVAARIDPCFPDLALLVTEPSACRRELRLVAQPLAPAGGGGVGFSDNAIHLLYDLGEPELTAMAARWLAVRTPVSSDPTRALGVHPVIATEGLDGPVATELRAVVTSYAGAATLSQFTFMEGRGVAWEFGGFAVANGSLAPIAIHGLESSAGDAQTTASAETGIFSIAPPSPEARGLEPLAGELLPDGGIGGGTVALTAPPAAIAAALQLAVEIENPTKRFNPDTLDCASCHVAGRAHLRAVALGASTEGLAPFTAEHDLTLAVSGDIARSPQQQRAFGYNLEFPVWNQRTINESAAIAAYFAAR